jgi:uncharacterized membrane protein YcaP (DUF421 family)
MDFVYIIVLSLTSIVVLFILTKLSGYRQISEMSFFDYVIGISIGSIAAEMATNIDLEWWKGVTAMTIYAVAGILLAFLSQKSLKARKFITGEPIVIIEKGKIKKDKLKKARIEVNDLLTAARGQGYFNLADIDYAIMEETGKISFMPVPMKRQLTPEDFNFAPEREGLYINVIIDGQIIEKDLKYAKITLKELESQMAMQNKKLKNIILATVDNKKQLTFYER